jgi:hypothetical protein
VCRDSQIQRQRQKRAQQAAPLPNQKQFNGNDARLKKQATRTLRTGTAGSQGESRCAAIHKLKGDCHFSGRRV